MKIAWVHIDMNNAHWTYKYYESLAEEKNCYASMDKVVFVSENAKNGFQKLFGFTPRQSIVIKNPIPVKKIQRLAAEYQVSNTDFTFVVVGDAIMLPSKIILDKPKEKPKSATIDFWDRWYDGKQTVFDIDAATLNLIKQSRG